MLQSARRERGTGKWYLPDAFQHSLVESLVNSTSGLPITHPWPHGARFAFVLTHDVEDQRGFRDMCRVADVEQELGFRSSFNLVPYKYPIDTGLVRELQSRGFEIGIHGYNHDGRLYLSERIFRSRLSGIHAALRKYEAVGFRSPMVHRNLEWLQMLDIEYVASCFDVDPYQAMPGGVGSLWPFMAGRFVELPYTLPQDHTLFIVLHQQDTRIWEEKLHYVARRHGMALMLTHPDYLDSPDRLRLYRDFLAMVNERSGHWHALPRDVARWWRIREQSQPQQLADGR